MAIVINGKQEVTGSSSKKSTHTQPQKPPYPLTEIWRVRKKHVQYLLGGISQSALDDQLKKSKRYEELKLKAESQGADIPLKIPRRRAKFIPQVDGYDPRPYWLSATLHKFLFG